MKRLFTILCTIAIAASISGCETTGGTIGGLIPAPKILKGKIENNTYYSQDGYFSIAVPHEQKSYEYTYMAVKEQYGEYETYVSFGPAAYDQSIYRVSVAKKLSPESHTMLLADVAPKFINEFKSQFETGYGTPLVEVSQNSTSLNGHKAINWVFKQHVPSKNTYQGNIAAQDLIHNAYVVDSQNSMAMLWVEQWPRPVGKGYEEKAKVKAKQDIDNFVNSFKFTK